MLLIITALKIRNKVKNLPVVQCELKERTFTALIIFISKTVDFDKQNDAGNI